MRRTALVVLSAIALASCTGTVVPSPTPTLTSSIPPSVGVPTSAPSATVPPSERATATPRHTATPSPTVRPAATPPPATPTPSPSMASIPPTVEPVPTVLDGWTVIKADLSLVTASSAGFVGIECLLSGEVDYNSVCEDFGYFLSQDGVSWSALALPAPNASFFTSDGDLMAGAMTGSFELTTWKWNSGAWDVSDKGEFDRSACGDIDDRDGMHFVATEGKTVATVGSVNWVPAESGWSCTYGPHIAIRAGHGVFVGTGETDVNSADESFWQSDDGLQWSKTQEALNSMQVAAVAGGFVAVGGGEWNEPLSNVYTSSDGRSWTQRQTPFGGVFLEWLNSDGTRAVTIEEADQPGTKAPGAAWVSSPDGVDWTRYQLPPRQGDSADLVAIWGNRLVVSGTSYNGGNSIGDGLVWSRNIP